MPDEAFNFSINNVNKPYELLVMILKRKLPRSSAIVIKKFFEAGDDLRAPSLGCRL